MKNDIVADEKINQKIISDHLLDAFSPQFSLLLNLLSKKKDEKDNEIEKFLSSPIKKIKDNSVEKKESCNFNFQINCKI